MLTSRRSTWQHTSALLPGKPKGKPATSKPARDRIIHTCLPLKKDTHTHNHKKKKQQHPNAPSMDYFRTLSEKWLHSRSIFRQMERLGHETIPKTLHEYLEDWRIIPVTQWLGSPPFISPKKAMDGRGVSHNPTYLRSILTITMGHP